MNIKHITEISNEIKAMNGEFRIQKFIRQKRKLLLFINPIGGKGHAIQVWNRIKYMFDLANIEVTVFRTQYAKHAYDHTLGLDSDNYDGILCCSGDGIVHEVVNAIFHREDRDEFMNKIPVGVIPGGTSNGFAKSLCEASGEQCSPELCVYLIVKGQTTNVDLLEIETISREKKIYSFLSVAWGIIADIDLESEGFRFCGPFRYTLYGVVRWMFLRNVFGALYYLPEDKSVDLNTIPSLRESLDSDIFIRENDTYSYFWAHNLKWTGETLQSAPKAQIDDGLCDLLKMKRNSGKCNLLGQLLNQDDGKYFDDNGNLKANSGLEYVKTKCFRLIPKNNLSESDETVDQRLLQRYYSIDGERYPIEPIQVKTLPQVLKVFCFSK